MSSTFTRAPDCVQASAEWSAAVLGPMSDTELADSKFTSEERVEFYSDNAVAYDNDMVKYSFRGPEVAAQTLHELIKDRLDSHILDVGCGTGQVATLLLGMGQYTNIDGLEPAQGMLEVALKKNLYKSTMNKFLYLDCGLEHNKYDAVVSSGTFVAGHMKSNCLVELCNVLKPGGYLVVTMRHEHLSTVKEYKLNFMPTINGLVQDGIWKIIKDELFPDWCFGKDGQGIDGHLFVLQKC